MENKRYLKGSLLFLLAIALSFSFISATDIIGDYSETAMTVISPNIGASYSYPEITFKIQRYIDYDLILDENYILPIQSCYLSKDGNYQAMSYSNSSLEIGEFSVNSTFTNGDKEVGIYCYNITEVVDPSIDLTYNTNISFNVDYTSIKTCDNLININSDLAANYELNNNIDCLGKSGISIGTFEGILDGQGYIISNYKGIPFIDILYGQVKNLKAINVNISGGSSYSGFIGTSATGSIIDNVDVSGEVKGGYAVGSIVGDNSGTIRDSESNTIVIGSNKFVGGITGTNRRNGKIINCISYSKVSASSYLGGISGDNYGLINRSYSYGNVSGASDRMGGIVGQNGLKTITTSEISSSYALGELNGSGTYLGGAIGLNYAIVKDSYYQKYSTTNLSCIGGNNATEKLAVELDCRAIGDISLASLNITANGISILDPLFNATGEVNFIIYDGWKPVMSFDYDYSHGELNFTDEIVTGIGSDLSGYMIVKGMDFIKTFGLTKTIYLDRMNVTMTDICIKDADIESKDEISLKCDGTDEYIVKCDGVRTADGYTCTLNVETNQYEISGLKHSGVVQTDAVEEAPIIDDNSGSAGGSSSGGGSSGCYMNYTCSEWGSCLNGISTRTCTNTKIYCYLGIKPETNKTCTMSLSNSMLVSAADSEDDNYQAPANHEDGRGKTTLIIVIGGAIVLIIIYGIFHLLEHAEMRKFRLRQKPITEKKN